MYQELKLMMAVWPVPVPQWSSNRQVATENAQFPDIVWVILGFVFFVAIIALCGLYWKCKKGG